MSWCIVERKGGAELSTDRIEREINIAAPPERVWAALTEPQAVGMWFGTGAAVEVDLQQGGVIVIDHGRHGKYPAVIVTVDPPRTFSYRWAAAYPGVRATEENSTLVEFTLEPLDDGTLLRVAESGFDRLTIPADREEAAGFEGHSRGWLGLLEKAGEYAITGHVDPPIPPA
jgi:uncharacterized protein YndB with AHSA1/START domain